MNPSSNFITIQGIRVHYLTAGEGGSTVVLLHGGGVDCAALSWGGFLPELAENYRVIAPDFPGYGESDRPDAPYSMNFYIQFLTDFLDQLEIPRASLAGISMGGGIALGFTLANPARVEKLVLVDSYGLQRKAPFHALSYLFVRMPGVNALSWALMRNRPAAKATLGMLLLRPGSLTDELVDLACQEMMREGADKAWSAFQRDEMTWKGARTCYIDRLGEIKIPTLIVHGTKDSLVPVDCAREAHVHIRGSQLHWVEGAGHWPQRDHPKNFSRAVQNFLRQADVNTP
jgi:pimeloyl-ACP methyl ester carboxylesterase